MKLFKKNGQELLLLQDECSQEAHLKNLKAGEYQIEQSPSPYDSGDIALVYEFTVNNKNELAWKTKNPFEQGKLDHDVPVAASRAKKAACVAGAALGTALMVAGTAACLTGVGIPVGAFLLTVGKAVLSLFAAVNVVGTAATVGSGVVSAAGAALTAFSLYGLFGKPSKSPNAVGKNKIDKEEENDVERSPILVL